MRMKSSKPIIIGLFALLIFVSVGLIAYYTVNYTDNDEPVIDKESPEIVLETKKESETLPDETSQPVDIPKSNDIPIIDLPKLVFPKPLSEYLDSRSLEDIKELQAIVIKYQEELKAHGMQVPSGKTYPVIENMRKVQAEIAKQADELAKQTDEIQRRFEREKKEGFELSEKIAQSEKEVQESRKKYDAMLAQINREWIKKITSNGTTPPDTTSNAWKTDLDTYMSDLDTEMVSKFPVVTLVRHLTQEEYDTYFDTADARTFLESQQKQMLTEISRRLNNYLSDNDVNRNEKIEFIRSRLLQDWNTDIVEKINKQLE